MQSYSLRETHCVQAGSATPSGVAVLSELCDKERPWSIGGRLWGSKAVGLGSQQLGPALGPAVIAVRGVTWSPTERSIRYRRKSACAIGDQEGPEGCLVLRKTLRRRPLLHGSRGSQANCGHG